MPGAGQTILVTGGGGYIGSHCILQLLQEDFNVIVVDNFVNSIKGNHSIFSPFSMKKSSQTSFSKFIAILLIIDLFFLDTDVNNPDSKDKCMYSSVSLTYIDVVH